MKIRLGAWIAILELVTVLVVKAMSHIERKKNKPRAGQAFKVRGHRVVKTGGPEYNERPPTGDNNELDLLGSGSSADEVIREE